DSRRRADADRFARNGWCARRATGATFGGPVARSDRRVCRGVPASARANRVARDAGPEAQETDGRHRLDAFGRPHRSSHPGHAALAESVYLSAFTGQETAAAADRGGPAF